MNNIPRPAVLERPLVDALEELGGKAHRIDVERVVARNLGIPRALAEIRHGRGNSGDDTELQYNLSWAGTALVKRGVIKKRRGIWSLVGCLTEQSTREDRAVRGQPQRHSGVCSDEARTLTAIDRRGEACAVPAGPEKRAFSL